MKALPHAAAKFAKGILNLLALEPLRAVRAASLGDPQPKLHDLRHAYATALLAAGLTVHAVAEFLGHSSSALVMARYGHAYEAEKASSAMALGRFCGGMA